MYSIKLDIAYDTPTELVEALSKLSEYGRISIKAGDLTPACPQQWPEVELFVESEEQAVEALAAVGYDREYVDEYLTLRN